MRTVRALFTLALVLLIVAIGASSGAAAPEGQMTWAVRVSLAPTLNAGMSGVGPRVEEPGFGLIAGYAFCAPYEELKLRGK